MGDSHQLLQCAHDVLRQLARSEDARKSFEGECAVARARVEQQTETISQLKEDLISAQAQLRTALDAAKEERASKRMADEEVTKLKTLLENKNSDMGTMKGQLDRELVIKAELQKQLADQSVTHAALAQQVSATQSELKIKMDEARTLWSTITQSQDRVVALEASAAEHASLQSKLKMELAVEREAVQVARDETLAARARLTAMVQEQAAQDKRRDMRSAEALNEVEALKREREQQMAERVSLQQQAARRAEELEQTELQSTRALQAVEETQRALKDAQGRIAKLTDEKDDLNKQLNAERTQAAVLTRAVEEAMSAKLQLQDTCKEQQQELQHLKRQLATALETAAQERASSLSTSASYQRLCKLVSAGHSLRERASCMLYQMPLTPRSQHNSGPDRGAAGGEGAEGGGAGVAGERGDRDEAEEMEESAETHNTLMERLLTALYKKQGDVRDTAALCQTASADLEAARTYIQALEERMGRHEREAKLALAASEQANMRNKALSHEVSQAVMRQAKVQEASAQVVASSKKGLKVLQEHVKQHVTALSSRLEACCCNLDAAMVDASNAERDRRQTLQSDLSQLRLAQQSLSTDLQEKARESQALRHELKQLQARMEAKAATCDGLEDLNRQLLAAIRCNSDLQYGVGLTLQQDPLSLYFTVASVAPTGPAAHNSSLAAGVVITHIDGVDLAGLDLDQVQTLLLGPENSPVQLGCLPPPEAPASLTKVAVASDTGGTPRERVKSGDFSNMLLNTTIAAKEMLSGKLFGSTLSTADEKHRNDSTDDARAFRVHVLRRRAHINRSSAASVTEMSSHTEMAKEAICCVQALRGENTSLRACVEQCLREMAAQAKAAGDAERSVKETWALTFGGHMPESNLQVAIAMPGVNSDFEEYEPRADDVGSVGVSGWSGEGGEGRMAEGQRAAAGEGASAQVTRDMKARRVVEAARKFVLAHRQQHTQFIEELVQDFDNVVRMCEKSLHLQASQSEKASADAHALEHAQTRLDTLARDLEEEQASRLHLAALSKTQSKELSQLQQRCISLEKQVALLSSDLAAAAATAEQMTKREAMAKSSEAACRKDLHMLNDKLAQLTSKVVKSESALSAITKERNSLQASLKSETAELQRRYKELEKTADSRARGWSTCKENLDRAKSKQVQLESENMRCKRELQRQKETIENQIEEIHTLRLHPVGIGIYIADKTFEIRQLVESAAAHASGQIQVGDFLVAIDGQDIESQSIKIVREMLLGPPGSWVSLELKRWVVSADNLDDAGRQRKSKNEIIQKSVKSDPLIVTGLDSSQTLLTNLDTSSPEITEPEPGVALERRIDGKGEHGSLRTESSQVSGGGQWLTYDVTLVRGVRVPTTDCGSSTASQSSKCSRP